jgi:hypothetical protein
MSYLRKNIRNSGISQNILQVLTASLDLCLANNPEVLTTIKILFRYLH